MLVLLHSSEVDQPNQALRIDQQVATMQIVVSKSNYNLALQRIYQGPQFSTEEYVGWELGGDWNLS